MVESIKCASCGKDIMWVKDEEILDITHFEIRRCKKQYDIEDDEIITTEENEKMLYYLCEECFLKVLNESETLGRLFWDNGSNQFIY